MTPWAKTFALTLEVMGDTAINRVRWLIITWGQTTEGYRIVIITTKTELSAKTTQLGCVLSVHQSTCCEVSSGPFRAHRTGHLATTDFSAFLKIKLQLKGRVLAVPKTEQIAGVARLLKAYSYSDNEEGITVCIRIRVIFHFGRKRRQIKSFF